MVTYRHRRTHDRGEGSDGAYGGYSGEEEEYEGEGDDHLGSLEEASPNSENGYLPNTNMSHTYNGMQNMPMSMPNSGMGMAAPSTLIGGQHLMQSQQI